MALDSSDKPQIQFWGTENKFLNNQELGGGGGGSEDNAGPVRSIPICW